MKPSQYRASTIIPPSQAIEQGKPITLLYLGISYKCANCVNIEH